MRALAATAVLCAATPVSAQLASPLPAEVLTEEVDPATVAWLRANIVVDGPVTGGLVFSFPEDFYRTRLILLGEIHGSAAPQVLDLELLTHLNARIGLTDYLAEVDPVQGAMLNHYLETGDEAVLGRVFDVWTQGGAQWGNTAFEAKIRGVRALNLGLPADRRVRILGIDAIQDWPLFCQWITDQGGIADCQPLFAAAADDRQAQTLATLAIAAVRSMPQRTPDTDRLLGVLDDLRAGVGREGTLFNTYRRAVTSGELGDRPAYGLWGLYHVFQQEVNDTQPFAARVRTSDLPAARSMASVSLMALDSAVQVPIPMPQGLQRMRLTMLNVDGPYVMVQGATTLRAASVPGHLTVFNPRAADSPLAVGDFVIMRSSVQRFDLTDVAGPIDDHVQYVGVYRDSDWAPPRE